MNFLACYSRKWVIYVGGSCVSTAWYPLQLGCITSVSHQVAAHYEPVIPGLCGFNTLWVLVMKYGLFKFRLDSFRVQGLYIFTKIIQRDSSIIEVGK